MASIRSFHSSTFTDLQTRDTTYTVKVLAHDRQSLDCEVTTTAKSGKYRITTDYITDPNQNSVVMRVHFQALVGKRSAYRLYLRYDPQHQRQRRRGRQRQRRGRQRHN